jgi:cyanophycinase
VPANGPADTVRGTIVAIGGGEDKFNERQVLTRLVELAGGKKARIVVFPTASSIPENVARVYIRAFSELGAADVHVVHVGQREDAYDPEKLRQIDDCTCVFLTGGDQLRLVSMLGGTPMAQAIRRLNAHGVPIAGTSAGAGAVCQHMIARGRSGQMLSQRMVNLAPGLGLTNRIVVDQHFSQRHRMGRLFTAVTLNPFLVGVGIDEDTAAALDGQNRLSVWGRGSVTVVDGTRISHTDIADVQGTRPGCVLGLSVHVLTEGCTYDLIERQARGPERAKAAE